MNIIEHNKNGLVYPPADGFEAAGGVAHGFSTRLGGVSEGIYATLNLGMNRGDAPDRVRENYRRFCAAIGADMGNIVCASQVHGDTVRTVTAADLGISPENGTLPTVLINDGRVLWKNLRRCGRDENWLHGILKQEQRTAGEIFLLTVDEAGKTLCIPKEVQS